MNLMSYQEWREAEARSTRFLDRLLKEKERKATEKQVQLDNEILAADEANEESDGWGCGYRRIIFAYLETDLETENIQRLATSV